jgi:hypothetical protein
MTISAIDPTPIATAADAPRPGEICRQLLATIDAAEGRRKRRKRNTTPDTIGLGIKRDLLERAARDDPPPEAFETWLVEQCLAAGDLAGPTRAMALDILDEWRMAVASGGFRTWLAQGAPSDDTRPGTDDGLDPREIRADRPGA